MGKITLDENLRKKLEAAGPKVELCDETGRTLGYFMTPDYELKMMYAWAKAQVSDEELERASHEVGGRREHCRPAPDRGWHQCQARQPGQPVQIRAS